MDIWKLFKYIDLKEFIFMSLNDIYPRKDDKTTIYLKNVITKQDIIVGDYTIYNDFERNPSFWEKIMFYITTL